ncbi:MAG TPA: ABC transporter permease [Verrucomicrobiae bacterium]
MNLGNTIATGFREIWAHKFRSLLTMLGIILGVSSLVAMSAMVQGLEKGLREALVAMGGLEKIRVEQSEELPAHQRHMADRATGVTMHDVYALKASAPLVNQIVPSVDMYGFRGNNAVTYRNKSARPFMFSGTWPDALALNEHVVEHGRMFNELEDDEARSVCVIGTGIRDQLFGDPEKVGREINPVGEIVNINGQPFTIIGMFQHYESEQARKERELAKLAPPSPNGKKAEASRGGGNRSRGGHFVFRLKNNTVYIPLRTMQVKFRSAAGVGGTADYRLTTLQMKVPNIELLEAGLQQVRNVMLMTHKGIEDFTFRTQEDTAAEITKTIQNARASGGIIAVISLIVGGIGIMNIMLASISERIREIGIRKAMGATTIDVFVQILVESIVIAVVGGVAGLFASYGLVYAIATFTPSDNSPIITTSAMLMAFACSAGVGVLAGLFPAFKASRLHPIQALKYD